MSGSEDRQWPAHSTEAVEADLVLGVALMKPLVLICSQDAELYLFLSHILGVDGFTSEPAGGVDDALALADDRELQAVVLDCGPTSATGSTICARLKGEPRTGDLPVIALIAPGAENQHLDLLKAGIDESFVRPIAPATLLDCLRTKLALPKPGSNGIENGSWLRCGGLEMKLDAYRVRGNGHDIHLGPLEFNLLRQFLETPGKVFSRDELIDAAWPDNIHIGARTVDVHISRIRKALKAASPGSIIRTVRSAGYSLEKPDD
ncbi:response regulator transcription factor [Mesorhizobium sp. YC-39]|uniref:Two-component system phosphate regulon response regulator PhoB n=1 Tax=Mesorhizobium robiniae TaxID=559315 RepID=A0ABV2GZK6_9HYPH|nr:MULTISPECIES: response regulator transcription factor [unclassified Mesorhizobium]MCV3211615.1 response regulator transcription factor [Mesorhizobium sp. YC-2]MCV3233336.1 response regulator transcription factor [Mesorhizobium sp. YC-39]MCV3243977.1 response regulator transcription factor [Mesorhizobium sp. ZC-5]